MLLSNKEVNSGENPEKYNVSYSSLPRERQHGSEKISENIFTSFETDQQLIVHWDGKMLEDISGSEMIYRLSVLISGPDKTQLLGVPKLHHGTGNNTAKAVYEEISDWNLTNKVVGMCFDTKASNTGLKMVFVSNSKII